MMMDAPDPSEGTIVRGPKTRSAGIAVNPPRPPAITAAMMQRKGVGVGVGVGVSVSDAVAVADAVRVRVGDAVLVMEAVTGGDAV